MPSKGSEEREPPAPGASTPSRPGAGALDPTSRLDRGPGAHDTLGQAALRAEVHARMFGGTPEAPRVARYAILKLLGEGGMGTVYAAYDDQLDRRVALKLLKSADTADARQRMLREAQALARLSHPNVVPVFEVGEHDGQLFVAMEYVRGVTLARWRADGDPDWREIVEKYLEAGRGLEAAHAAGMVHRDFKPHNAVVGHDGRVRVLDFGLATGHGAEAIAAGHSVVLPSPGRGALDSPLTESGTIMGTPAYMPPEQFMGGEVDPRGDQFSFCVALWEALYGERPFAGANAAEIFTRVAQGKLVEPPATHVPASLRTILERGLRAAPGDRWPDMTDLLSALGGSERRLRSRRRLLVVAALATAMFGWFGVRRYGQARASAQCESEGASIDAVWNDEVREQVRGALLATGVSYAETTVRNAMPWIDAQALAWRDAQTQTCLDRDVREVWRDELYERSSWCLDERRSELAALVERLARADQAQMPGAIGAAAGLTSIEPCRDASGLELLSTPPHETRDAIRSVRAELARASALGHAGGLDEGIAVASDARARALALEWPPVLAQADLVLGRLHGARGDFAPAERHLGDAYFGAQRAGQLDLVASASTAMAGLLGDTLSRFAEAMHWSRHTEIALLALGDDGDTLRTATHLTVLGTVHMRMGALDDAKAALGRALEIQHAVLGEGHPATWSVLGPLAEVALGVGDYEGALATNERGLSVVEHALGSDHPTFGILLEHQGSIIAARGDMVGAIASYERARGVLERAVAPDDPTLSQLVGNLAAAYFWQGEYAKAEEGFRVSLAGAEARWGTTGLATAIARGNLASSLAAQGEGEPAQRMHEAALAAARAAGGDSHAVLAGLHHVFGTALVAAGRSEDAEVEFRAAVDIRERTLERAHPDLGASLAALGRVLLRRDDPQAALPLLERAWVILGPREDSWMDRAACADALAEVLSSDPAAQDRVVALRDQASFPLKIWKAPSP